MSIYLYEVLYRGQPAGSAEAPDYHVVLADQGSDIFGRPTVAVGPAMTPDQAKAHGFGLPEIMAAINEGLLAENAALKAELAERPGEAPPPTE